MEEIKINVPDGYEIDRKNSTLECIMLRKKDDKPRSWNEYVKNASSGIAKKGSHFSPNWPERGYAEFDSLNEADAFAALGKLIQLRDVWWGEWRPDWSSGDLKYCIESYHKDNSLCKGSYYNINRVLAFPTAEMRDDFYDTFIDLIEDAKMFL